jgi:hypothetical protein
MSLTKVTYSMIETASFEPIQLVVGNDPSYTGTYDFSDLRDAIQYCTGTMLASGKMSSTGASGSARYQITIPVGTHTFSAMTFRGANLSGIQVWGASRTGTIIKCKLSNTTNGVWLNALWSNFSDWGNFTLIPSDDVTVITDPAVVCQPWPDTNLPPPWSPNPEMKYIGLISCTFGRMWSVDFNASSTGCRLGTALDIVGTTFFADNLIFNRIRNALFAYDGTTFSASNAGITASNIYTGFINHQSNVYIRKAVMSGILNGGAPYAGSHFGDCIGGTTTFRRLTGTSIQGFDYLMSMGGGIYFDQNPRSSRSNINTLFERQDYFSPLNVYGANIITIDADFLPDSDILSKDMISYNDPESAGTGLVTYAGDNTSPRVIAIPKTVKQVTVRDLTSNISVTCIRSQLATISGNNAVEVSSVDGITRVYLAMNATGTNYELVWQR